MEKKEYLVARTDNFEKLIIKISDIKTVNCYDDYSCDSHNHYYYVVVNDIKLLFFNEKLANSIFEEIVNQLNLYKNNVKDILKEKDLSNLYIGDWN